MKLSLTALSLLCVASTLQAQDNNRAIVVNEPYFVQSTGTHPVTGDNYNWPPMSPANYTNGSGVGAGTSTFSIVPMHKDVRYEDRMVSGFTGIYSLSAASGASGANAYDPQTDMQGVTLGATGFNPPSNTTDGVLLVSVAQTSLPRTAHLWRLTVTFTAVAVPDAGDANGYALVHHWAGGEEQNVADGSTGTNPSQCIRGTWMCTAGANVSWGFQDAAGTVTYTPDQRWQPWVHLLVEGPHCAVHSDYGQDRGIFTGTPLLGHSVGTNFSDMASAATNVGFSVRGGASMAGHFAVPLLNIQPAVFPFAIPFNGIVGELNPADPLLSALSPLAAALGSNGELDTVKLPIPVLAGTVGIYIGFEVVTVDLATFTLSGSTNANWVLIDR